MSNGTPLIDLANGRDQDDRSDLYLAFKRCAQWRKVTQTNLHVRELLFWVMAVDRDGKGISKSAAEIADRLELKDARAARYVIQRAAEDFKLLVVSEGRYQRGGQTANRYAINWPLVRAIRDGIEDGNPWRTTHAAGATELHPPTTECDAGATELHPPTTELHPYKEHSRTNTRTITRTTTKNPAESSEPAEAAAGDWQSVVSCCRDCGLSADGAAKAVEAARERGLTPVAVIELAKRYDALAADSEGVTPGWLYRWLTGDAEPPAIQAARTVGRGDAMTKTEARAAVVRCQIVRAGRRDGLSEEAIAARCRDAGVTL
jgi:hypothetical protein